MFDIKKSGNPKIYFEIVIIEFMSNNCSQIFLEINLEKKVLVDEPNNMAVKIPQIILILLFLKIYYL